MGTQQGACLYNLPLPPPPPQPSTPSSQAASGASQQYTKAAAPQQSQQFPQPQAAQSPAQQQNVQQQQQQQQQQQATIPQAMPQYEQVKQQQHYAQQYHNPQQYAQYQQAYAYPQSSGYYAQSAAAPAYSQANYAAAQQSHQQNYNAYSQAAYYQNYYAHYQQPQVQWGVGAPTGKKKALLVGINYLGHRRGRLSGCINDVKKIYNFIVQKYNFPSQSIRILTDDQRNPAGLPTRRNIIDGIRWLVMGAAPGDSLVFHFSGHGGQVEDLDGDESDGLDETIMPMDYHTAGHIIDDDLNDLLVKPLPAGVRLLALMDCCHSGTGLDLPYTHQIPGEKPTKQKLDKQAKKQRKAIKKKRKKMGFTGQVQYFPSDVIMFSGCRDDQTSADTNMGGESTGAMSYAFSHVLSRKPQITYEQLLIEMRKLLAGGAGRRFNQVPQMSASRPFNMNTWFYL